MEKIIVRIDGTEMTTGTGTELLGLVDRYSINYMDNPIAAAYVNGSIVSLREKLEGNAEIKTIRTISPEGKRIYRKSLCFLLCYASALIAPDRTLIIGHSLGDGFFFRYRDGHKPDTEKLRKAMEDAVRDNFPIDLVTLTAEEALKYSEDRHLEETKKLLLTENGSEYRFARLGTCYEMYYEPMLPSAGYIGLWELMDYEGGLLLRYPQSRSPFQIMPFADNPLLFSVFSENKRISSVLGIESLGDLNMKIADGSITETIRLSESLQRQRIVSIARAIKEKGTVKAVFIAGPSSSGKTTSSMKLTDELRLLGYDPIRLSLDDYYLSEKDIPLDENGEKDFDVLHSLDIPLFRSQLTDLAEGREIHPAVHSFREKKTVLSDETLKMEENSILIIEGIHGLNPALIADFPEEMVFRVYISALTQVNLDTRSRISTTDNRILRRMVRDARTRGITASETLRRWPQVERGEKNNIFPFQNNADVMINSALEYELPVIATYAIPLLKSVKKEDGEPYAVARRLLEFLSIVYPLPSDIVPPDSTLREFIGGSIYGAI